MHIRSRFAFLLVALFLMGGTCFAADPASYKVSMTLSHADEPFASPSLVVQPGTPANFEVAGADGYTLTLVVTDLGPDTIKVAANVDSTHGSMAPVITVHPGEPAAYSVGDLGLALMVRRSGG